MVNPLRWIKSIIESGLFLGAIFLGGYVWNNDKLGILGWTLVVAAILCILLRAWIDDQLKN